MKEQYHGHNIVITGTSISNDVAIVGSNFEVKCCCKTIEKEEVLQW